MEPRPMGHDLYDFHSSIRSPVSVEVLAWSPTCQAWPKSPDKGRGGTLNISQQLHVHVHVDADVVVDVYAHVQSMCTMHMYRMYMYM